MWQLSDAAQQTWGGLGSWGGVGELGVAENQGAFLTRTSPTPNLPQLPQPAPPPTLQFPHFQLVSHLPSSPTHHSPTRRLPTSLTPTFSSSPAPAPRLMQSQTFQLPTDSQPPTLQLPGSPAPKLSTPLRGFPSSRIPLPPAPWMHWLVIPLSNPLRRAAMTRAEPPCDAQREEHGRTQLQRCQYYGPSSEKYVHCANCVLTQ